MGPVVALLANEPIGRAGHAVSARRRCRGSGSRRHLRAGTHEATRPGADGGRRALLGLGLGLRFGFGLGLGFGFGLGLGLGLGLGVGLGLGLG